MEVSQISYTLNKATGTDFGKDANRCLHVVKHVNLMKGQEEVKGI